MSAVWEVEQWVNEQSLGPVARFYPTAVAKETEISLQDAFTVLMQLVETNKLRLLWEIRCPRYECARTVQVVADAAQLLGKIVTCHVCGEEFDVAPDVVFPVFEICPEYKDYIKKNKRDIVPV
ncbi:hypothetical protein [Numidum massiliense]|uniref:hypothetical protein n=1 Tax=Numidum massiliense TaxID=1522315 RepID=UPI0006D531D1|nr:hypothetical protein [Numidum massiliense]